jgi:uncharacterized repeat protein (TIGR03803 family)
MVPVLVAQYHFQTIYPFTISGSSQLPGGNLVADSNNVLYGTTCDGGLDFGTVFKLTPPVSTGGAWKETLLYSFKGANARDGACPQAGLVLDASGTLYGTTSLGGSGCEPSGCGTVFKLLPPPASEPGGRWIETVLWMFENKPDGRAPFAPLALTANNTLYGTTSAGGTYDLGTVFQLTPPSGPGNSWAESGLYSFGFMQDGGLPNALTIGKNGFIYGTTLVGGASNEGTVFQLVPPAQSGQPWTESLLYNFTCGLDGCAPQGGLVISPDGSLYGTASGTRGRYKGTVFQLSPSDNGTSWTELTLHLFGGSDGSFPIGNLIMNRQGELFGTTALGGYANCPNSEDGTCGVVFKIRPPAAAGAPWISDVLYKLNGGADGGNPNSGGLTFGSGLHGESRLFGMTIGEVANTYGVAYEITQ